MTDNQVTHHNYNIQELLEAVKHQIRHADRLRDQLDAANELIESYRAITPQDELDRLTRRVAELEAENARLKKLKTFFGSLSQPEQE